MRPVRDSEPLFAVTVKPMVPFPLPLVGGFSVIQLTSKVACQVQPGDAEMPTLPEPPAAVNVWPLEASEYEQKLPSGTRHTPRPCVNAYSRAVPPAVLIDKDSVFTLANPVFSRPHVAPPSTETYTPMSVPM